MTDKKYQTEATKRWPCAIGSRTMDGMPGRIKTASLNAELANWRALRRTSGNEPVGLLQHPTRP